MAMRKVKATKQFGRSNTTKFEIAKLELHDGDILVLRTELVLSRDQIAALRAYMLPMAPKGVKLMVLSAGLSLAVIEDKRKRAA
jgi:hypothetical protein